MSSSASSSNFLLTIIALSSVIFGCIWNSYELELVVSHKSGIGKDFGYGLTVLQCIGISIIGFVHFLISRFLLVSSSTQKLEGEQGQRAKSKSLSTRRSESSRRNENDNNENTSPPTFFRLSLFYAFGTAILFWAANVLNNIVFQYGIAVPIMQVVRSSSLLTSAVVTYFYVGKKFSVIQVFLLICITAGIAFLSLNSVPANALSSSSSSCVSCGKEGALASVKNNNNSNSTNSKNVVPLFPDPHDPAAILRWFTGLSLCILSAFFGSILGMMQDRMFKEAKARIPNLDSMTGVTEEAIFRTHAFCVVIFAVLGSQGVVTPVTFFLNEMPLDLQQALVKNVISQYLCIWGVFSMGKVSTAFYTTMATTVRKFFSLVMSLMYFGHLTAMSWQQLFSIALVTVSVSMYPFVKGPTEIKNKSGEVRRMEEEKVHMKSKSVKKGNKKVKKE